MEKVQDPTMLIAVWFSLDQTACEARGKLPKAKVLRFWARTPPLEATKQPGSSPFEQLKAMEEVVDGPWPKSGIISYNFILPELIFKILLRILI